MFTVTERVSVVRCKVSTLTLREPSPLCYKQNSEFCVVILRNGSYCPAPCCIHCADLNTRNRLKSHWHSITQRVDFECPDLWPNLNDTEGLNTTGKRGFTLNQRNFWFKIFRNWSFVFLTSPLWKKFLNIFKPSSKPSWCSSCVNQ